jgi:hypothetical protein
LRWAQALMSFRAFCQIPLHPGLASSGGAVFLIEVLSTLLTAFVPWLSLLSSEADRKAMKAVCNGQSHHKLLLFCV